MLVIRDLFCGKSHYRDFLSSPEKIATNILANRLQKLLESGVVKKRPSRVIFGRDAYHLTRKGKSLWPILEVVADWGLANLKGTEKRLFPQQDGNSK